MRLDRLIRLPWWVLGAAALAVFLTGHAAGDWAAERGKAIRTLMERPSAPVTGFADLKVHDPAYTEAAFEAQVVVPSVTELSEREEGRTRRIGTLLPLADPEATLAPKAFTAFLLIEGPLSPDWEAWIAPFVTDTGALGPRLSLEGEIAAGHPKAHHARDALGPGAIAPGAVWVKPYRDGRSAALERDLGLLGWGTLPFYGVAIFLAVMAGARFLAGRGPAGGPGD